ncbi:MAG TPA: ABC transporter substrate-binding protein, partial [Thermomicrobiales bacterium]|nr:ABC transporter substrate-binding protein [Thermomicrobiales bacterium]
MGRRVDGGRLPRRALLASAAALALGGCGNWPAPAPIPTPAPGGAGARPGPSPVASPAPRGGRATVGLAHAPATLDPALAVTPVVATLARPVVEGLIAWDDDGRPVPWLAAAVPTRDNGGVSADGRVVTYRLRPDVAWDDGQPFTAADVAFTFAAFQDTANPFAGALAAPYASLRAVDALDPYTVRLAYDRPDATYLAVFQTVYPAHFFNGRTRLADAPYGRGPAGTGPFRFQEWAPGDHLTLARSASYRVTSQPNLDELDFRFLPDGGAALDALRRGDVDLLLDADPAGLAALHDVPGLVVEEYSAPGVLVLVPNVANRAPGAPAPPLADRDLRRALALALDRPALAAALPGGLARPAAGPLGDDAPPPQPPVPAPDPTAAGR